VPGGCKGHGFRDFAKGLKTLRKRLGSGGAVEETHVMISNGRIQYDSNKQPVLMDKRGFN
jgi:translation initiation factor 1 (eIF-1/SUI1)